MAKTTKVAELPMKDSQNFASLMAVLTDGTAVNLRQQNIVFMYRGQVKNCADAKAFGAYTIASTATDCPSSSGAPFNGSDLVLNFGFKEGYYPQYYVAFPSGRMWLRGNMGGDSWNGWEQFPIAHPTTTSET